ncbi:hypothetical protein LCGC14_1711640 [marine sediment metagenome]|uniref:Uncharacterized protein n=1 Tax=marine sediment metagenome TaxID=412755 RepID=A0A0F9HFI9_9ZZZZ
MNAKDTVMETYGFNLNGVIREVPIKEITINLPGFLRNQAEITWRAAQIEQDTQWRNYLRRYATAKQLKEYRGGERWNSQIV